MPHFLQLKQTADQLNQSWGPFSPYFELANALCQEIHDAISSSNRENQDPTDAKTIKELSFIVQKEVDEIWSNKTISIAEKMIRSGKLSRQMEAGNCQEMIYHCFQRALEKSRLLNTRPKLEIFYCSSPSKYTGHFFLVIDSVVCDPWANLCFPWNQFAFQHIQNNDHSNHVYKGDIQFYFGYYPENGCFHNISGEQYTQEDARSNDYIEQYLSEKTRTHGPFFEQEPFVTIKDKDIENQDECKIKN
jgi:hypothetical protein